MNDEKLERNFSKNSYKKIMNNNITMGEPAQRKRDKHEGDLWSHAVSKRVYIIYQANLYLSIKSPYPTPFPTTKTVQNLGRHRGSGVFDVPIFPDTLNYDDFRRIISTIIANSRR